MGLKLTQAKKQLGFFATTSGSKQIIEKFDKKSTYLATESKNLSYQDTITNLQQCQSDIDLSTQNQKSVRLLR